MCPDCKDGFYYPFAGPREPCQTCQSGELYIPKEYASGQCIITNQPVSGIIDESTYPSLRRLYREIPNPQNITRSRDTEIREARELSNEMWKANKPTDWEHWFPVDDFRCGCLASILVEHPTKLATKLKPEHVHLTVISHVFKTIPLYKIRNFFHTRTTVQQRHIAVFWDRER